MSSAIRLSLILLLTLSTLFSAGCGERGEPGSVEVVYGDTSVVVGLGEMDAISAASVDSARLSEVVEAAELGVDLAVLEFDFESADGFRSSDSSNCVDFVPMAGEGLALGYIALVTGDLVWDESLDYPGCLRVDGVAKIHASDAI